MYNLAFHVHLTRVLEHSGFTADQISYMTRKRNESLSQYEDPHEIYSLLHLEHSKWVISSPPVHVVCVWARLVLTNIVVSSLVSVVDVCMHSVSTPCIDDVFAAPHLMQGAVWQAPSAWEAAVSTANAVISTNVNTPTAEEVHGRVNDGRCSCGQWTGGAWLWD